MQNYQTLMDAWQAFEAGQYERAARIWQALIAAAPDALTRRSHQLGYCEVLQAQGNWSEARSLLQQLQSETGEALYAHQLGLVERAAGNPEQALKHFETEASLLDPTDTYALAAHALEQGLTWLELGQPEKALTEAEASLKAARSTADPGIEALAHRLLGDIALARQELQRARECYADAAVSFAMAGNEPAEQEMARRIADI